MNFEVKNDKNVRVGGKTFNTLDEANKFISINDGYGKGWYIQTIHEAAGESTPTPTFLTEA